MRKCQIHRDCRGNSCAHGSYNHIRSSKRSGHSLELEVNKSTVLESLMTRCGTENILLTQFIIVFTFSTMWFHREHRRTGPSWKSI
jgi:uncharacterized protein YqhQ